MAVTVDQHLYQPTLREKEKQTAVLSSIGLNVFYTVVELIVAFFTGSIATASSALHDLSDSLGLGVTYIAQRLYLKSPTSEKSFGNLRITIIAAFFNAMTLVAITVFIFARAYDRIKNPEPVPGLPLILLAVGGLITSGIASYILYKKREEVDMKSIFYHTLQDSLGFMGVLIAGLVLTFTNFYSIDPIISIVIGFIVLYGAYDVMRETLNIFLEGVPRSLDVARIKTNLKFVFNEIEDVHDLHVWVLGPGRYALSAHLAVEDMTIKDSRILLNRVKNFLRRGFNVWHTSLELECPSCVAPWGSIEPVSKVREER